MFLTSQRTSHHPKTHTVLLASVWVLSAGAAACLLSPTEAQAQATDLGVGIIVGEPTGLTGKFWMGKSEAVDVHLAFSFSDDNSDSLLLMSHYLMHFDVFDIRSSKIDLPIYVGIGAKLGWWDHPGNRNRDDDDDSDLSLGVRIPVGLDLLLKKAPLEFFLEIAPSLWVIPSTRGDIDAGIGARFYF